MSDSLSTTKHTAKKGLSDDAVDAITAIVLILVAVSAAVFWLSTLPSS